MGVRGAARAVPPRAGRPVAPLPRDRGRGCSHLGSPIAAPRLRGADVVPPAGPSRSGASPPPRPGALPGPAAAPSQAPSARRRESRAEVTAKANKSPASGWGDLSGRERRGRRPSSPPFPPPCGVAEQADPAQAQQRAPQAPAEPRPRAREGSGCSSAPPPGHPAAKRLVWPSAGLRGGAGGASSPYLSAAVGGTCTESMGKMGHGCAPERGPHRRCVSGALPAPTAASTRVPAGQPA